MCQVLSPDQPIATFQRNMSPQRSCRFGQVRATVFRSGIRTSLIFNPQHIASPRNVVAKPVRIMLRPTVLRYAAFKCCHR